MEEECLSAALRGVKVWGYDEVREELMMVYSEPVTLARSVRKKAVMRYLARLDRMYEVLDGRVFNVLSKLPNPRGLNPFYAEVLAISGITDYATLYSRLRGFRKVVRKLWKQYRLRVKLALTGREARDDLREFVGRSLSIMRRLDKDLRRLESAVSEIRKLPCIDFTSLKVVVAGMPQVGKSTLVGRISTSKPEVSPFPFTTKNIVSGHVVFDHLKMQVFDTPGMLDRPISELNEIERRALVAIKFLADVIIYMVDPRSSSYYPVEQQLDLLQSIKTMFAGRELVVAVNKIDEVDEARLNDVCRRVSEISGGEPYRISALKGLGVDVLLDYLRNRARDFRSRSV
ncbi:MAG: GTPase [Zestosphaera sp.]